MAKRGAFEPLCKEFLDKFGLFRQGWKHVEPEARDVMQDIISLAGTSLPALVYDLKCVVHCIDKREEMRTNKQKVAASNADKESFARVLKYPWETPEFQRLVPVAQQDDNVEAAVATVPFLAELKREREAHAMTRRELTAALHREKEAHESTKRELDTALGANVLRGLALPMIKPPTPARSGPPSSALTKRSSSEQEAGAPSAAQPVQKKANISSSGEPGPPPYDSTEWSRGLVHPPPPYAQALGGLAGLCAASAGLEGHASAESLESFGSASTQCSQEMA